MPIPTYSRITDGEVDLGSPLTPALFDKIRNNLLAAFKGDPTTTTITTELDTSKVLRPDGLGGVSWGYPITPGSTFPIFLSHENSTSGSFSIPSGVTRILAIVIGAGGGGGGWQDNNEYGYHYGAGSGGCGAVCFAVISVEEGQSITYQIGAGGTYGSDGVSYYGWGGPGATGGQTRFGCIRCSGGAGGEGDRLGDGNPGAAAPAAGGTVLSFSNEGGMLVSDIISYKSFTGLPGYEGYNGGWYRPGPGREPNIAAQKNSYIPFSYTPFFPGVGGGGRPRGDAVGNNGYIALYRL